MKYAIAFKINGGVGFVQTRLKTVVPGILERTLHRFDNSDTADSLVRAMVPELGRISFQHINQEALRSWKSSLTVVAVPDEADARFDEADRRIEWCLANPTEGVPAGSSVNSLTRQAREIEAIIQEGFRILTESVKGQV